MLKTGHCGIQINVTRPAPTRDLSEREKSVLKDAKQVRPPARKITPPGATLSEADKSIQKEPGPGLAGLIEGYHFIIDESREVLRAINIKIEDQGLDMPLDPVNDPETYSAAHRLFSGNPTVVTNKMYLILLSYLEDIGLALAQTS